MRRIVVIAAGMSGISCAARIKHLLPDCELNLILPPSHALPDAEKAEKNSGGRPLPECLRRYEISVMEAHDIMPDLAQREITISAPRGRLTIPYTDLLVEAPAAVRLPRSLSRADNIFAWPLSEHPAPSDSLRAALCASKEKQQPVVVTGNGLPALEAVLFVRQAGQKALWMRTGETTPALEPHLLALVLKHLGQDVACIHLPGITSVQLICRQDCDGRLATIQPPAGDPVEASVCLWTAPLMARHPLLRENGITLDAFGRIEGAEEIAALGVRFIGSGAAVPAAPLAGGRMEAPVYPGGEENAAVSAALAEAGLCGSETTRRPPLPGALRAYVLRSRDMYVSCAGFTLAEAQALTPDADQAVVSAPLMDAHGEASRLVLVLIGDKKSRTLLGAQVLCLGSGSAPAEGLSGMAQAALTDNTALETLMQRAWSGLAASLLGNAASILATKGDTVIQGISPDELLASRQAGAEFFTLDLRSRDEWAGGHTPDAYNIPLAQLKKRLQDEVPRHTPLVLICATGSDSYAAAVRLAALGASDLYVLDGGMELWPYPEELSGKGA